MSNIFYLCLFLLSSLQLAFADKKNKDSGTNLLIKRIEKLEQELQNSKKAQKNQLSNKNLPKVAYFFQNITDRSFNPSISLILDGRYASFHHAPKEEYIAGFLQPSHGLGQEGFSVEHTELSMSANVDDKFYGQMTFAIAEHDDETEIEMEEAFIQTLKLGNGFVIKMGRFFSNLGYLNEQHAHNRDFVDVPLVYKYVLGGQQLIDDGIQLNYVSSIKDLFLQLGAELLSGKKFPLGSEKRIGSYVAYANLGGDIGDQHSWQVGANYLQSDNIKRRSKAHSHDEHENEEIPLFEGDSKVAVLDFVYKFALNGNFNNHHVKLQFEYFIRDENGNITMLNSRSPVETSTYTGTQTGFYIQMVHKFATQWRYGLRYERLHSKNEGYDSYVLEEANLVNNHDPSRYSTMLEWIPSEFSRIRLQYNYDKSYAEDDSNQFFIQYTHSLGSHGAHKY